MSTKTTLKTGKSLYSFLDKVIEESVKSSLYQRALQEKEKQAAVASTQVNTDNSGADEGGSSDIFSGDDSGDDEGVPDASKTMDDESEKLKKGDIKPRDIVDKLNSIRSGKSFKDSFVNKAMDEYIGSLSRAEKVALLTFLKGIAQIVTGEIPGQQAMEPSDAPSDVSMQKGEKKQAKHIDPNVIKVQSPKQKPTSGGAENTAAPTPITPKKR
jgi:hypothetical protein